MKTKSVTILLLILYSAVLVIILNNVYENQHLDKPQHKNDKIAISTDDIATSESPLTQSPDTNKKIYEIYSKSENLLDFIYTVNQEQPIQNQEIYGGTIDLVILVQVHNRLEYLEDLINSLKEAEGINKTLLVFSHDFISENMNKAIDRVNFTKTMQIFYPFSLQTHPRLFPGADPEDCQFKFECENKTCDCQNLRFKDLYGNFRNASLVQIKHHWWWKMNFVFKEINVLKNYKNLVLFLEEDHYLAPDFIHSLHMLVKQQQYLCSECWFYGLGFHNKINFQLNWDWVYIQSGLENLGLAFNRSVWNKISRHRELFCKHDDYNWDWSLKHAIRIIDYEIKSLILAAARAIHIGSCGAHFMDNVCNSSNFIEFFRKQQVVLFPAAFSAMHNDDLQDYSVNGGWGDPRDHALCMAM